MSRLLIRFTAMALCVAVMPMTASANGPMGSADKIAHFHLSGMTTEKPRQNPFDFTGSQSSSFKDLIGRLSDARTDDSVKAIVLTMSNAGFGAAQLEEMVHELRKFRSVGKRVFVHVDGLQTGSYALMSAATDLSIVPTADIWLTGMYSEAMYLRSLLDKLDVQADIIHIGEFKSAGEMLTRTEPSEPALANINWLFDGIYGSLVDTIAESRSISPDRVRSLMDKGPYTAEQAKEAGLVDSVMYRDQFLDELRKIYGSDIVVDNRYGKKKGPEMDFSNPFAFFQMFTEMFSPKAQSQRDAIGVVYVEGMIATGYQQPDPFGGGSGAYSGDIEKALRQAADDSSIKAVVLRVDSPGGSALASEIIWRATQEVRKKKPLIVSMGNVAGSGGYYVSCGADTIFADEMTITASIGVVGGKLITNGLWDKLGVSWYPVSRGANADLMNTLSKFSDGQRAQVRDWMTDVYKVFKGHIQDSRGEKLQKPLDELAAGRVFTGKQALKYGLVDKIGGFSDAVEFAARKASISDYDVRVVPEPKNLIDMIFEDISGTGEKPSDIDVQTKLRLRTPKSSLLDGLLPELERLEPARAAAVKRALQTIELFKSEAVLTAMPFEFVIH